MARRLCWACALIGLVLGVTVSAERGEDNALSTAVRGVALEVSSCNPWAFLTNASGKSQTHVEGLADTDNRNQAHNRQLHTAAVPWSRNTKPVCYSHESIQQPEVKLTIPSIVALGPARFTRLVFDSQFLSNERMVLLLYSTACPHSR
ncbi:hypothetical protein V8C86DRAFT_2534214 [Haematococcus lacustris]